MSTRPVSTQIRARYVSLLPPRVRGVQPLSELAGRLRADERDSGLAHSDALVLLAEAYVGAWPSLIRRALTAARGLSAEGAEDVVANLTERLDRLYSGWREEGSFAAYLDRTLQREALSVVKREGRGDVELLEDDGAALQAEALSPEQIELQNRALLRFAWFLYGSPDNPRRLQHDKAMVDFLAISSRLTGRPYAELVSLYQPRPGSWDLGRGEADRKWWRGRATLAQRQLSQALEDPALRAVYERILTELKRSRPA